MLASSMAFLLLSRAPATIPLAHSLSPVRCATPVPEQGALLDRTITLGGTAEQLIDLPAAPGQAIVVQAVENGIDVILQLRDAQGRLIARAQSPVIRTGRQLLYLNRTPDAATIAVVSREHAGHAGEVRLTARVADSPAGACGMLQRILAAADMRYAQAHAIAAAEEKRAGVTARDAFDEAARRYATIGGDDRFPQPVRAGAEHALATLLYYDQSRWEQSAEWALKAAARFATVPDDYARARAQAVLASAWIEMATASASGGQSPAVPTDARTRLAKARELLIDLERFHQRRGEAFDAALQTNNIGLTHFNESDFARAIEYYEAARKEFERLGQTSRVGLALQNIGLCEWGLGRISKALPLFDRSLELIDRKAYADLYLLSLNSSALARWAIGRLDEALRMNSQALEYAARVENDYYRGKSFMGLGLTYYAIGDRRLAAEFLRSAIGLLGDGVDARGHVTSLRSLAQIEHDEGRFAAAAKYNVEALRVATAPSARARIRVSLAANYAALGEHAAALEILRPMARGPHAGDRLAQAQARLELGRLLQSTGENSAARQEFVAALRGFRAMQSVAGEFDTRLETARLDAASGHHAEALASLSAALALSDEIATQTVNPEYRASVAESLRPAQDLMIELQFARYSRELADGRTDAAHRIAHATLEFADATRARAFGQILVQRFEQSDPRLAAPMKERERLLRELADRRFYLSTRDDRAGPDDRAAIAMRAQIATLRARLGVVNAELAERMGGREAVTTVPRLNFRELPAQRALIEYWLAEPSSYAWIVSSQGTRWVRLDGGDKIRHGARELHAAMEDIGTTPARTRAARLADARELLIRPLGSLIGIEELVIAADGPLHIVPFAALHAGEPGGRYLVQDVSVSFVPALRYAARPRVHGQRPVGFGRALLVADPIYQPDDQRLTGARSASTTGSSTRPLMREAIDLRRLSRLPSTRREADAIRVALGSGTVDSLEGATATRAEFLRRDLASYRYVHVAAHGIADTEIPQLSALILGAYGANGKVDEQRVWVADLLTKTFNAEIVVLSACGTSLGPEFAGEGPIGLSYAVLGRGARSAVSSLWAVADEMGARLMTEMYHGLTRQAYHPSEALTMAMRALLEKRPKMDPALWAAYVVVTATPPVAQRDAK
jgi:CHAT domain-containing protein